ncbi:winged helix DNA-binding protein [Novosphingobium lentum]|uniref:winged helix DNA-binding protein n=1 Tax=Novosphingobium lentum TaxID=145287 RepID=UPI00082F7818|nr:winged helix DNA-binding protein [Novosphingobium lentum]
MSTAAYRFDRDPANDFGTQPLVVSIFADRSYLRAEIAEDAAAAGLRVAQATDLAQLLLSDQSRPDELRPDDARADQVGPVEYKLGDLVLVDCPVIDGAEMAALSRLDMRVAQCGAQMVVSTSIGSLDDVFGCLDQSDAQILVTPSRAERMIALGRIMARGAGARVRELGEDERLALLRLTEQVTQIAQKLDSLSGGGPFANGGGHGPGLGNAMRGSFDAGAGCDDGDDDRNGDDDPSAFRFRSPAPGYTAAPLHAAAADPATDRLVRASRHPLPDPRLIRRVIRQRQLRARFFEGELFADPAWDMLLDLTAARAEHIRVSVTSLCIASGVPPTTALRWIGQMTDVGLLQRVDDETDRRRAFITLTEKAADAMARYFGELGNGAAKLV